MPEWQHPNLSPVEIMTRYGRSIASVPSAKAWAKVEGARIHFFTVVDVSSPSDEKAVCAAERDLIDVAGPDSVVFEVYPDEQSLEQDPAMMPIDRLLVA